MILKKASETSSIIFLSKKLIGFYFYAKDKIARIYRHSYLYNIVTYFADLIEKKDIPILQNSKIGYRVINLYKKLQRETADCLGASFIRNHMARLEKEFNPYPFKASGILLISAVSINLVLFYIFQRKLRTLELIIRVTLLMVGFLCLFCDTNWAAVKKGSALLKILSR